MSWEDSFASWARPLSDTEQQKADNAVKAVRAAMKKSPALAQRNISVFTQGSYRNNTNVRGDSDVDVCILCRDTYYPNYAFSDGLNEHAIGLIPATYLYPQYKNEVEAALRAHFGSSAVRRGNKAFDIHENTYRVDADVVACFEHRRYMGAPGSYYYLSGTEFQSDAGGRIINWPEQHYANGVSKNKRTNLGFKACVRIVKRLENELVEGGLLLAGVAPSFLIECLLWNVPDEGFTHSSYTADVRYVLAHLANETRVIDTCSSWGEINELKYLFRPSQPWSVQGANRFLNAAWDYIGFK